MMSHAQSTELYFCHDISRHFHWDFGNGVVWDPDHNAAINVQLEPTLLKSKPLFTFSSKSEGLNFFKWFKIHDSKVMKVKV